MNVLIVGESWVTHATHIKGFDAFTTTSYVEGVAPLRTALESQGHVVTYVPNHLVSTHMPNDAATLGKSDVVILSDVGANTLLLSDDVFIRSKPEANRLHALRDYVHAGGGLLMIGGYLTFQGIEAKGAYAGTAVEEVLPITFHRHDDRHENPQGVAPSVLDASHPVMTGLEAWPNFLGYNRSIAREDATVLAMIAEDPFIAVREVGAGRSAIFASDCGPHWGPPEFLAWKGYATLWNNVVAWLAGSR